jgi:hypothetical protein
LSDRGVLDLLTFQVISIALEVTDLDPSLTINLIWIYQSLGQSDIKYFYVFSYVMKVVVDLDAAGNNTAGTPVILSTPGKSKDSAEHFRIILKNGK